MKRDLRNLLVTLLFVALFSMMALGQETTGSIEITVKDAADAVVPNVALTVTSSGESTGFKRTVTADDSGFARLLQVPPGLYLVTANPIAGFVEQKVDQVSVGLGRTTPVNIVMGTSVDVNVTVTADSTVGLDLTDTKMQTTISSQVAELIPKGLNFSSVLKFSPAARPEPRSGQFQIDGASGSENTFIIDGQEVTDILTGALDRNSNLPFSIIQETQIKTSGFEAEFGGATGGVINVVTKGGSNAFHGELGLNLRTSRIEPRPGPILFSLANQPAYYQARRNPFNETNPTATLLGPIWKNKVWFSMAYAPQIVTQDRILNYSNGRVEHYYAKTKNEKVFGRLDAQPWSKLHLTSTFQWNPEIQRGSLPGYSSELGVPPKQALPIGVPDFDGAAFLNQTGGRLNSVNFTGSGSYVITDNLIVSARYGHYFLNNKLGTYGFGNPNIARVNCAGLGLSTQEFPMSFGCQRRAPGPGNPNPLPTNNGVTAAGFSLFDATTRDQFDADATYSFRLWGRHELKGGYQDNKIGNIVQQKNTDLVTVRYGTTGQATIGSFSGNNSLLPAPGAVGSGELVIIQTEGDVSSKNTGIYVQDKWQPTDRLTFNLGLRAEQEGVPSYTEGLPGMDFSWGSKLAPRLGVAYDLTGDGKTKISGFYGLFYDRFKLTLPRGSFGGDKFHKLYFDLFPGDTINNLTRETIMGGANVQPIDGGSCPQGGTTPIFGRVRCDRDERINSNTNSPGQDIGEVGGVDPDIKPFQQREITVTFQRQLTSDYLFSARYSRKQVVRTIEDVGFVNSEGSTAYLIANPGEGLAKSFLEGVGLIAPKPERKYDALELRIDKRFANNYFFSANYTYSRLRGNYGGLASSDEEGRLDPNVERYFDEPSAGFTVAGGPDNGLLATDRPHVLKAFGAYTLGWDRFGLWKNNETDFNVFYTISSGSLITTFVDIRGVEQIILTRRGDQGRTPVFSQTDFAVRHNIKFGRDGRYRLSFDTDIINLFNQYIVTNRGRNPSGQGGNIISETTFDILNPQWGLITQAQLDQCALTGDRPCFAAAFQKFQQNGSPEILAAIQNGSIPINPFYNIDTSRQGKRTIRYGIRFVF